jgi:hypothetical protein
MLLRTLHFGNAVYWKLVVVFWVMTQYSDVVRHQHFRGPCCQSRLYPLLCSLPTSMPSFFLRNIKFTLKMEAAWSSETLVSYITTWCHNPDDNLNLHHENLKSYLKLEYSSPFFSSFMHELGINACCITMKVQERICLVKRINEIIQGRKFY